MGLEPRFFTCIYCMLVDENGNTLSGDDDIFGQDVEYLMVRNEEELVNSGVLDKFTSDPSLEEGERLKFEAYVYEYQGVKTEVAAIIEDLKGDEFLALQQSGQLVPIDSFELFAVIEA